MTIDENSSWLRIDEQTDVLTSLHMCLCCLSEVGERSEFWKWAILALHNAFQGAMVCHLSGTANLGALSAKSAEKWLAWHEKDRNGEIEYIENGFNELGVPTRKFAHEKDRPPKEFLADPKELFERLQSEKNRIEKGVGSVIIVNEEQKQSFAKLHELRREFAHFTPKGWSIELSGLPKIFCDVVDLLQSIQDDPWPFRHLSDKENRQLSEVIQGLRHEISNIPTGES